MSLAHAKFSASCRPFRVVADWIYPEGCAICGRDCLRALPLCHTCRRRLIFMDRPICTGCGNFVSQGDRHPDCEAQSADRPALVWFAGLLDEGYRPLIHALKYERQRSIGDFLGRRIGRAIVKYSSVGGQPPLLVPVPLHPSREKQRGYNQALVIASGLARSTGFNLGEGLLARIRKTKDQTKLSPAERMANVRGAFTVRRPGCFSGRRVILIDDVMTTGATLNECARMVYTDNAEDVQAVVIALARPLFAMN